MGLFSNRQQQIPQRFIDKADVDRRINECYDSHVSREDNVIFVDNLSQFGKDMKPLREEQLGLRIACANFIKDQQTRGPEGMA